jgi:hypothetical protein
MVANGPLDTIILRGDWRQRIVRENEALARRLQAAYARTLPRLRTEIDVLDRRLRDLYAANGDISTQELRDLREWKALLTTIEAETRDFAVIARNETAQGQQRAISAGASAAQEMAQSTSGRLGPAVATAWNRPDPAALERLINYVDGAALRTEFAQFGARAAEQFADVMLTAVAQGKNPLALARIMEMWLGVPYAQAENLARTTQLWSYRSATHAAYRANSEVVTGWLWYSAADARTCISCWDQHGSVHSVNEMLDDHHRGRCVPVPIVRGTRWADDFERGPERFDALDASVQRRIMGGAMYAAWRAGEVRWGEFSRPYQDNVFGEMLRAASLRDLLGDGARRFYTHGR